MKNASSPSKMNTTTVASPSTRPFLFTSESVTEGHPDKLCDRVSDAILDACLAQDPNSKVACETATKTAMVMVFGEITSKAEVDFERVVRDCVKDIGYTDVEIGLDYRTCNVIQALEEQSPDIAGGVHIGKESPEKLGAGDQGLMFGYATDETEECMPLSHVLATKLAGKLMECRKSGELEWIRPDGKTQVTVEYVREGALLVPRRVHTILISTQHSPDVSNEKIHEDLRKHVIDAIVPDHLIDEQTIFVLNPSGRFIIGGPHGDAGLTGRKIIVDTYGGWGAHGGGAFSGKDPTKVDRSGAYAARWAAKSLVKAGMCNRCLIQLSYAIGVPHPLSIFVDSFGTGVVDDDGLIEIVKASFDFRPGCIIRDLDLKRPIYHATSALGHFGRTEKGFTWEVPKPLKGLESLRFERADSMGEVKM